MGMRMISFQLLSISAHFYYFGPRYMIHIHVWYAIQSKFHVKYLSLYVQIPLRTNAPSVPVSCYHEPRAYTPVRVL